MATQTKDRTPLAEDTDWFEAMLAMPHDEWCATKLDGSPSCSCIRRHVVALVDVAWAAHELVHVTSHVNLTGEEYQDRKLYYERLRLRLTDLRAAR